MGENQPIDNKSVEEPKKKLEALLVLSAFLIGYIYIYIYQNMLHIEVEWIEFQTLIEIPLIAIIVIPSIHYLIAKLDPLQRSPSKRKSIRFFQNEFPSKYIKRRCERCIENERSCPNYIKNNSSAHIKYWFYDIFRGSMEKENPKMVENTFEKGYTCKLLYYLQWILGFFLALSLIIIVFHHLYLYLFDETKIDLNTFQIFFPLVSGSIIILTYKLHNPDKSKPSGCWQAWREINRMHIEWLRENEDFLVNLICQAGGGTKRFRER